MYQFVICLITICYILFFLDFINVYKGLRGVFCVFLSTCILPLTMAGSIRSFNLHRKRCVSEFFLFRFFSRPHIAKSYRLFFDFSNFFKNSKKNDLSLHT